MSKSPRPREFEDGVYQDVLHDEESEKLPVTVRQLRSVEGVGQMTSKECVVVGLAQDQGVQVLGAMCAWGSRTSGSSWDAHLNL